MSDSSSGVPPVAHLESLARALTNFVIPGHVTRLQGPGYPPRHPSRVAHHLGHVTDTAEFVSRHKLARRRPGPPPGGWA